MVNPRIAAIVIIATMERTREKVDDTEDGDSIWTNDFIFGLTELLLACLSVSLDPLKEAVLHKKSYPQNERWCSLVV